MAEYMLIRTTPDGVQQEQGPFRSRSQAARFAGLALYDNWVAEKREAQRFSVSLAREPEGTVLTHMASGYAFRIERTA